MVISSTVATAEVDRVRVIAPAVILVLFMVKSVRAVTQADPIPALKVKPAGGRIM